MSVSAAPVPAAPGRARHARQQRASGLGRVEQQARGRAACVSIRRQHGAQALAQVAHARVLVGHGAGRAHGGAGAAALAQSGIHAHRIAGHGDGAGGAHVQAAVAAVLAGAAVGAQVLPHGHVLGLLEFPHQGQQFDHGQGLVQGIAARRLVAVGQGRVAQQGRVRQVQHQVEAVAALGGVVVRLPVDAERPQVARQAQRPAGEQGARLRRQSAAVVAASGEQVVYSLCGRSGQPGPRPPRPRSGADLPRSG